MTPRLPTLALVMGLFGCARLDPAPADSEGNGATSSGTAGGDSSPGSGTSSSSGGATGTGPNGSTGGGADTTSAGDGRYHPIGFADPTMHGPALKLQAEDCRGCHGLDLMGGTVETSCDSCHEAGWREDCVYCHGGITDQTGAPPRDIDETTDVSLLSFIAHSKHVTEENHPAYDCVQCHTKPMDVLSEGHIFDGSAGKGETAFAAGLSPLGVWDGVGTCGSLYCHGNGRNDEGTYMHDQPTPSCGGCHAYPGTEQPSASALSGRHQKHASEGVACRDCHVDTDGGGNIATALLHVNGEREVAFSENAPNLTFNAMNLTCVGSCHGSDGENHNHQADEHWNGG